MTDATRAGGVRPATQSRLFVAKRREGSGRVSDDDVLYGDRLRLFALAGEIGVRAACRAMGVHHSTYYRWKARVDRWGLEALRPRERRRPWMPNELGPQLEQRVLAFSLAHPGFGPKRISAELAREKWGGLRISANGIWRVLGAWSQHPPSTAEPDRRLRRRLGAQATAPRTGAAHRREPSRRDRRARLLLRRPPLRHQGHRLAVHGDRRRLRLCLGGAAHERPQPGRQALLNAGRAGRARARRGRLAAAGGDHR